MRAAPSAPPTPAPPRTGEWLAREFLVAVVGMLVAQAMRGHAERGLRDLEAPKHVVETVGVLDRGAARCADVVARRNRPQRALDQFLLLRRLHWDVARASTLGAIAHPQELLAVREVWRRVGWPTRAR